MKKFVSIALALVLALSLAVVAFAALPAETTESKTFAATYTGEQTNADTVVYGAEISWNKDAFAYTWAQEMTWNPADLDYTTAGEVTGEWTDAVATVTVTNKSNATIQYKLATEDTDKVDITVAEYATIDAASKGAAKTGTATVTAKGTISDAAAEYATVTVYVKA